MNKRILVYSIIAAVLVVIVILLATLLPRSSSAGDGTYKLDIIHINDFHARFEETSVKLPVCKDSKECIGGMARLFTAVKHLKEEHPDALFLNAGDSFQGTYWYRLFGWNATAECMNMLPHDAHALGNHEFDSHVKGLVPYLKNLKAPMLVANMIVTEEPTLKGLFQPYLILERNGKKIGIFGITTKSIEEVKNAGKTRFLDERTTARDQAAKLASLGVDIIIMLSHSGIDVDLDIAKEYGENIDIIVGGHSHTLLYNGPAPSGERASGTYPMVVKNNFTGHAVVVVQASAFTKYVGAVTVHFDSKGRVVSWDGKPIFLDKSIKNDPKVLELLQPYADKVHAEERSVIGHTSVYMDGDSCPGMECNLGNLACDAFLEVARNASKNNTAIPTVALVNRGNLRTNLAIGAITVGDLYNIMPYDSLVDSFQLQGRFLLQALEQAVSEPWTEKPFLAPHFLQVGGLRIVYNTTEPEGHRVKSVEVQNAEGKFAPLDNQTIYSIVATSYIDQGGDGFTMISDNKIDHQTYGLTDFQATRNYVSRHSPLTGTTEGRITMLS